MVALQTQAVEEVVGVFQDMGIRMNQLVDGLKGIVDSTQKADQEQSDTFGCCTEYFGYYRETANSAEVVQDVVGKTA